MLNVIRSDIFRLRKGKAVRNTLIGVIGLILLMVLLMKAASSEAFSNLMDSANVLTEAERLEYEIDLNELQDYFSTGATGFVQNMFAEGDAWSLFLLAFIIAVFGSDFSAGTYRNTLSNGASRRNVYLGKFIVSILCWLLMMLCIFLASFLLGILFFGIGESLTLSFFTSILMTIILQSPIYLACIAIGHLILAITKKSGATIAAYILILVFAPSIIEAFASFVQPLSWMANINFSHHLTNLANYAQMSPGNILGSVLYGLGITVIAGGAGLYLYQKSDLT